VFAIAAWATLGIVAFVLMLSAFYWCERVRLGSGELGARASKGTPDLLPEYEPPVGATAKARKPPWGQETSDPARVAQSCGSTSPGPVHTISPVGVGSESGDTHKGEAMSKVLSDDGLDLLFRQARTHNVWLDKPVDDALLRQVYDLAKMGPTSANMCPLRLVYFPDENHWILRPQNSRLWHREFFAWLEKYIGHGPK